MAGENLVLGVYNRKGAAHDIESLKPNILSEAELEGLIEVAQLMLRSSISMFNYVTEQLFQWLNKPGAAPLLGDKFNERFLEKGTQAEISAHLDMILPLE